RQFSPVVTVGGGVVIDAHAPKHRRSDASTAPFLETLERGSQEEILAALAARLRRPLAMAEITARAGWTEVEIRSAVKALSEQKRVRVLLDQPLKIAAFELVSECAAAIRKSIEEFHGANPLLAGVPKQELRGRVGNPDADLFPVALDDAVRAGATVISGDLVRRAGREIALTPEEASAKDIIEREFETAGLTVPSFSAVLEKLPVERARAQKIFQILLREKALIKVAEDLAFHRTAVAKLRELVAGYKKQKGASLPVPAFKELTGVTRKYAIPLLEYLDREHVTRRTGDQRVIL
ncbi:MAG TPA: SelB C-terminal domain-containing protein, partial [Candidatus Acidoferrales bacterium]|nr:SelB C-terminal domain-containing protein [Candidatus Acidoferrales bacterium]